MAVKCIHSKSDGFKVATINAYDQKEVRKEVKSLQQLQHENILKLCGCNIDRTGTIYIFLELMDGSIADQLNKDGPLALEFIRPYALQILSGLSHIHTNGIVHQDLKCANLLLSQNGSIVKIADFGIATKIASTLSETKTSKVIGNKAGTPKFMAPEMFKDEKFGRAADIWSFGCCVIEMATGHSPWSELEDRDVLLAQLWYKVHGLINTQYYWVLLIFYWS